MNRDARQEEYEQRIFETRYIFLTEFENNTYTSFIIVRTETFRSHILFFTNFKHLELNRALQAFRLLVC